LFNRFRPLTRNYDDPEGPKFTGSFATAAPPAKESLAVVSYNVFFAQAIKGVIKAFRHHPPLAEADIILLQEMDEQGTAAIAHELQYNYVYYPAWVHRLHGRNFGNAILTRWPLLGTEKILLPGLSPFIGENRTATKARLQVGEREMVAYSTHTEIYLTPVRHRREQVEALVRDIANEGAKPVIVGGDFNTVTHRGIRRIVEQFAQVGLERASKGAGSTMIRFAYRPTAADHIFVRGLRPLNRGVVREAATSDHAALWVELQPPND
jgi:endonuclease/exonuclease/phosphatase (EEP) superfamily protein YafD